jgi:arylsulfatase A-like enzyme
MEPASTVDIAPTLAKELGIRPEEQLDGVALRLSTGSNHGAAGGKER